MFMVSISFSCVIAVARTSITMLNGIGEGRHPCLIPDLSVNIFRFCPLSVMFAVGFLYMAFIMLRYALFSPTFLSVFILNGC